MWEVDKGSMELRYPSGGLGFIVLLGVLGFIVQARNIQFVAVECSLSRMSFQLTPFTGLWSLRSPSGVLGYDVTQV